MAKSKKINPKRKPLSWADANKIRDECIHLAMAIFLMVLKDDFDFNMDQIQHAWNRLDKLSKEAAEGRINLSDLVDTLREEYGVDLIT